MEEHIGERINEHRSKEIAETNSTVVGSNCPFCLTMISDGMKAVGKEEVETLDIAEIVARSIEAAEQLDRAPAMIGSAVEVAGEPAPEVGAAMSAEGVS